MNFNNFQHLFSSARISRYLSAASNNQRKTQKLYVANLKVAQAFHPLLGLIEIVLRNKIDLVLTNYFNDNDWITTQINGFMSDPSLTRINKKTGRIEPDHFLKQEVGKAQNKLNSSGAIITHGKIIAEQNFSFWTELFELRYYKLLLGNPIKIFSRLPPTYGRKEISQDLTKIRKFRNRINHNEPICFGSGNDLDFTNALEVYHSIKNILSYIDPDLNKLVRDVDVVKKSIRKANYILHWWNVF